MKNTFTYKLTRRKGKRTVTLSLTAEGELAVSAPQSLSQKQIDEVIERQASWIEKRLARHQKIQKIYPPRSYQSGDIFYYLGKPYLLELQQGSLRKITLENEKIILALSAYELESPKEIAGTLQAWYEGTALFILKERAAFYEAKMKVKARSMEVKTLRSCWGSCGRNGHLKFNSRILMAPLEVIDYVVVHELSHLLHPNHSFRFWDCVYQVIPDYKTHRKWLREHGLFLKF